MELERQELRPYNANQGENENERMKESLIRVRKCFDCALFPPNKIAEAAQHLDYLQHALEINSTWNHVPTANFFPDATEIRSCLRSQGVLHLGEFLAKSYVDVSTALHAIGVEYPLILRRLYEAYHLSSLCRRWVAGADPESPLH